MALSGTFGQNYGSYLRIQGDWTATQDKSANTSTVTLRTYWIDRGSSTGISSSASKSGNSTIEGTSSSFSATAGLYRNQKKLIHTQTRTISHNSDGTFPDLDLAVSFSPEITFSGATYNTVSASASFALNTIPRESSIASDCSWTAGGNETISISRGSTSFTHLTQVYVKNRSGSYVHIKNVDSAAGEMYVSTDFSVANHTEIFDVLDGRDSADTRFVLHTYSGSTKIGESTHYGTVTAPSATRLASGYDAYWYTDEAVSLGLSPERSDFTHTVRFTLGSFTKTFTSISDAVSWNPSSAEEASMHAQMVNDVSKQGNVEIDTFYNGEQVRTTQNHFFVWVVRDANPVFSGTVTYSDNNASVSTITGNNQYIVQGKSIVIATLSAAAVTPQKGATMKSFVFKLAGKTETRAYTTSAITVNFGTIDAETNQTIIVEAVDSRGNRSTVTKIVNVVPYSPPTLSMTVGRVNGFEETTLLNTSGAFSKISVAGVVKNYLTALRYRTRQSGGTWSGFTTISRTTSGNTYDGAERTLMLDITKSFEVQVDVIDRLDTKTTIRTVGVGRPILFIDDVLKSIAFNDFPKDENTFLINGKLSFAGNQYVSGNEGSGAIDLNNGDIMKAKGIYFDDLMNNSGKGLLFRKTGTPSGSTVHSDYDNFYIRDGKVYMNNTPYFELDSAGVVRFERDKGSNGYNNVTARDPVNHDDPMLIQSKRITVSVSGSTLGSLDISWDTAFSATPIAVQGTAVNALSLRYNVGIYNISSTGCKVYVQNINGDSSTLDIDVEVLAIGRRS